MITDNGEAELKIFGAHNMMNIYGAQLVCQQLGITERDFYTAVRSFEGTANRLELVMSNNSGRLYKDFAHAPSKVSATVKAVREQFPDMNFIACLELHTFSSLNIKFISEYQNALDSPDYACVYYNEHTLSMKRLPPLNMKDVNEAFNRDDMKVFVNSKDIVSWLNKIKVPNTVYLMMSSGNFDGINFDDLATQLLSLNTV